MSRTFNIYLGHNVPYRYFGVKNVRTPYQYLVK